MLATASAPEGEVVFQRWNEMARAHYRSLGVRGEPLEVRTRADALSRGPAAAVREVSMVFFSGGNPRYLHEVLLGTPLLKAIHELLARGGVYAGCSAGAMITGDPLPEVNGLTARAFGQGLGLVPRHLFGVHWDAPMMRPWRSVMGSGVPADKHLLGISERTAVFGGGDGWTVYGKGSVEHRFAGGREWLRPGQTLAF